MNIKAIVCDLDGTLAPSKSSLKPDMAEVLVKILAKYKMAVVTGGSYEQFNKQFISNLPNTELLSNLYLFPTNGSACYVYDTSNYFKKLYSEELTKDEKEEIFSALNKTIQESNFDLSNPFGEIIEDRGSQISFSGRGQLAPLEIKEKWDPDQSKRKILVNILKKYIPNFEIRIGGATTIDITRSGINKAYAINKILEIMNLNKDELMFIGDALYDGGNDSVVIETGVQCKSVKDPEDTKNILLELL
jgi:HAD superfamily hydrolase (TIGR01484 family)